MNTKFKKLALAAAVSTGLAAASMPTHAIMQGAAGEAFLVPLVVHGGTGAIADPFVNTVVRITVPSTIGFDGIPNFLVASHTTPTNPGPSLFPADADLTTANAQYRFVHWYWFDHRSVHRLNRAVPITAEDVVEINWFDQSGGGWANQAGYMVIGTEIARTGAAANFAFYADAWLLIDDPASTATLNAYIPALPMADGIDGAFTSVPTVGDQVKYTAGGIPREVAPLISGIRTNRSDGLLNDFTVFDIALSDRTLPSLHVVWLDKNQVTPESDGYIVGVDVYDTTEKTCSSSVNLPNELNVTYIPGTILGGLPPAWSTEVEALCVPTSASSTDNGYVRYLLPEYVDTNADTAETAGVAFGITYEPAVGTGVPNTLDAAINLAHERGTYKF